MKLSLKAGTTSKSVGIFIQDSSKTDGSGLAALVFNTSNLIAYWWQPGVTAPAAITLATLASITSAWSSGGFKEADATHTVGDYRLDIPDACLTGATSVIIALSGATNMAPVRLEIELTAWNNQDAVHGGMSALPNTACTTNASLLTSGTGTDQVSVSAGKVLLQATQTGVTIPTVTTVTTVTNLTNAPTAGDFTSTMKTSITTAATAATPTVTAGTVTDKTGYSLAASQHVIVDSGTVTTLTNLPTAPTDWLTAAAVKADAVTKIQAGLSTYAGGAVASVTGAVGSVTAAVTLDKTQALSAARDISAVADTSLTLNDAMHCAIAAVAGQETQVGTVYTTKTPSTATVLRIFALDSASAPTTRT